MIMPLNDDQKAKMMKVLADAFDHAATHSPTKELGAIAIAGALQTAGYRIVPAAANKHELVRMERYDQHATGCDR